MPSNFRSASLSCLALIGCTAASFAAETILYSTDFSDFGIGDDLLVGTDGWLGTNQDEGIHGTIEGAFTDGNVAGTLGFGIPEFTEGNFIASIWRPINVDPIANDSLIRFSTDTAIIDSDNQLYDSFLFSVVNQDADVLGSIIFDNTVESFGIWRYDGVTDGFYDTEVSYEYANGIAATLKTRYLNKCYNLHQDLIVGTKGVCELGWGKAQITGETKWRWKGDKVSSHQVEHDELFADLRSGNIPNNGDRMAKSTLMGIMGRMSAYTGQRLTWEEALASKLDTMPKNLDWDMKLPVGEIPAPGVTPFI